MRAYRCTSSRNWRDACDTKWEQRLVHVHLEAGIRFHFHTFDRRNKTAIQRDRKQNTQDGT